MDDESFPSIFPFETRTLSDGESVRWMFVKARERHACTDLQLVKSGHHDLGVIRVQQVSQPTGATSEGSQHESTVRNALRTRRGHANWALRRHSRDDFGRLGEGLADNGIGNYARFLLHRLADGSQQHDLLLRPAVLLVDAHDVQQAADGEKPRGREARDTRIRQRDGQVVALQAAREAPNADLSEMSELAGHLGLEDHPDADALAVQHSRRQDGFDRVSDRVSKVDEVA